MARHTDNQWTVTPFVAALLPSCAVACLTLAGCGRQLAPPPVIAAPPVAVAQADTPRVTRPDETPVPSTRDETVQPRPGFEVDTGPARPNTEEALAAPPTRERPASTIGAEAPRGQRDERPTRTTRDERPTGTKDETPSRVSAIDPEVHRLRPDADRVVQDARREPAPALILLHDRPLEEKIRVRGPLVPRSDGRWTITDSEGKGVLAFGVTLPAPRANTLLRREVVSALANRRELPSGTLEGVLVHEPARVLYLFERILDVSAFTPAERLGFSLRQVTTDRRGVVTSGVGRTIYNVPVEIRYGDAAITLMPGQSGAMLAGQMRYRVTVHLSRFAVLTDPAYPLEEARSHIEYTIAAI